MQLLDKVIAAVGRCIQPVTLAVPLAADGNIAVEIGIAVRNGLGTGTDQITGREQFVAVHVVDVIAGVQVEHGTGQIFSGFLIDLVHTDAGMLTVIVETKSLLFSQFRRGFRCAYNIKMLFTVALLNRQAFYIYYFIYLASKRANVPFNSISSIHIFT